MNRRSLYIRSHEREGVKVRPFAHAPGYRAIGLTHPGIVRLQFDWEEIR